MNAKKTIKKILALGAGVTMVGATIMGAMAYDLANYPAPFIQSGVFNGKIVIGENAKSVDTIGALDIATSLQAAAVSKTPVKIPGQVGEVNLGDNAFRFETSNDMLEIREAMGHVYDSLTETELPALASGTINAKTTTTYDQYLNFNDGTSSSDLQPIGVNYERDKNRVDDDFLIIGHHASFFEWQVVFNQGLKSDLDSNKELQDLDSENMNVFGSEFTFVNSKYTAGPPDSLYLDLMSGSVQATLTEGETKTFTIDGVDYSVTLIFVSDPQSGSTGPEAKFNVNGFTTRALSDGDTERLPGGMQIGIRDVLSNPRAGVASIYLGADKVSFKDDDLSSNDFSNNDCTVEVGDYELSDAYCEVDASVTNTEVNIKSISYRLKANPTKGSTFYIPAGHSVREFMDEPEALLSPTFDIRYEGLKDVPTTMIDISSSGDDEYWATMTNSFGNEFDWPLLSSIDGHFRYGDDTDSFIFAEDSGLNNNASFNIHENDYFLVSDTSTTYADSKEEKGNSFVLTYDSIKTGTTKTITFSGQNGERYEIPWTVDTNSSNNILGTSDKLRVGGNTYDLWILNDSDNDYPVAIDLDNSGAIDGGIAEFVVDGGGIVNFADAIEQAANGSSPLTEFNATGQNVDILYQSGNAAGAYVNMSLTTVSSQFDTPSGDETFTWKISYDSDDDVTMSFGDLTEPSYLNGSSEYNKVEFLKEKSGDLSHTYSSYGAYITLDQPSNSPEQLTIDYPEQELGAQVFVVAGKIDRTENGSGAVTTDTVNPISVGYAIFDSMAPAIGSENMIVVGGPCVNTVAAALMNSPADDCTVGFVPGKALIKSFEDSDTGNVALLVAGYEGQATQGASRVLANYADYAGKLMGDEVEVVVPSLSDLTVQAVTPAVTTPPATTTNTTE